MQLALRRTGWVLMLLFCAMLVVTTLHYFGNDTSAFFQPDVYVDRIVVLRVHIAAGAIAILSGPLQFRADFRNRFPKTHRTLGKIYITAVLISAIFGLLIATTARGGIVSQSGFSVLAMLWVGATVMAYSRIRAGDVASHKRWMIRSFALTFAFVTLRILFPALQFGAGFDQTTAFQITAWACWITNLLIVELALQSKDKLLRNIPNDVSA